MKIRLEASKSLLENQLEIVLCTLCRKKSVVIATRENRFPYIAEKNMADYESYDLYKTRLSFAAREKGS